MHTSSNVDGPNVSNFTKRTPTHKSNGRLKGLHEGRMVGFYTQKERQRKINKYKQKVKRWALRTRGKRNLIGRSQVARLKIRVDGKFCPAGSKGVSVSHTGYTNGLIPDYEVIKRNKELAKYAAEGDINNFVGLAIL